MNKTQPKYSVVVPVYNSAKTLKELTIRLEAVLASLKEGYEIIFVNDGSTDQSKNKILKFIKKNAKKFSSTKIKLISYIKNMGKGYALKRGIFSSKADWIVTCDLDMSVSPEQYLIWRKKKLIKDINCAYIASRGHSKSKVKSKFLRRRLGDIFRLIIFLMFNIRTLDTQCGFKVYHKNYIKNVFKKVP